MHREAWVAPGEELARQSLGDGVALDETRQQALAEELHHRLRVPGLDRVKRARVRDCAGGYRSSAGVSLLARRGFRRLIQRRGGNDGMDPGPPSGGAPGARALARDPPDGLTRKRSGVGMDAPGPLNRGRRPSHSLRFS